MNLFADAFSKINLDAAALLGAITALCGVVAYQYREMKANWKEIRDLLIKQNAELKAENVDLRKQLLGTDGTKSDKIGS